MLIYTQEAAVSLQYNALHCPMSVSRSFDWLAIGPFAHGCAGNGRRSSSLARAHSAIAASAPSGLQPVPMIAMYERTATVRSMQGYVHCSPAGAHSAAVAGE